LLGAGPHLEQDVRLNIGLLCLELGRLGDAEAHLQRVIRASAKAAQSNVTHRRPNLAKDEGAAAGVFGAMAALGDVYARQMRVELAKKTYHRVVKAMPADTRTLFKLSALHAWLGALNHGEHMPHREVWLPAAAVAAV
jgi:predicted Zn-dependent protease